MKKEPLAFVIIPNYNYAHIIEDILNLDVSLTSNKSVSIACENT